MHVAHASRAAGSQPHHHHHQTPPPYTHTLPPPRTSSPGCLSSCASAAAHTQSKLACETQTRCRCCGNAMCAWEVGRRDGARESGGCGKQLARTAVWYSQQVGVWVPAAAADACSAFTTLVSSRSHQAEFPHPTTHPPAAPAAASSLLSSSARPWMGAADCLSFCGNKEQRRKHNM